METAVARYDHTEVEAKWQKYWVDHDSFATPTDRTKPKFYVLDMFPYPSGSGLHVGHPKGYVASDIVARAKRMMGFNVLHPMGWDSFGLPAERQAVKEGIHPREVTQRNVATFKGQLMRLGLSYDWNRELATSNADYYKWTQWIFKQLYDQGLAYRADVPVNWCPALGTVLSNEEVNDGKYVETGDPVEQRLMKQWMFKITEYADRLLAGLDDVDWPESTEKAQREWIGRSEGAHIHFVIPESNRFFTVFTTRPDTLFGCTYAVLAPEHPLVDEITADGQKAAVAGYREAASKLTDRDRISQAADGVKTGAFTGAYCINPVNGERVPVWVADYVLATYGTGAVFACPAHDERDWHFAQTFDLPIRRVIEGGDITREAYTKDGPHVNSEFLDGLRIDDAKKRIIAWLQDNQHGEGTIQYKLRDWLFSRQRYWGEPFPIIELEDGTVKVLPESALPVEIPHIDEYKPTADGRPPLARATDWLHTTDPDTGAPARRETNTMPQWAGSCWYYLRFIDPHNAERGWSKEEEDYWMPVDLYIGGSEHAVLHLLYARFWHQVLYDQGHVSTPEPFQRLYHQGMIHAIAYNDDPDMDGKYFYPHEVVEQDDGTFVAKSDGRRLFTKNMKMSKSRYNVTNPDDMCEQYGADSLRLYELFMTPLDEGGQWADDDVSGCRRFLDRSWRLADTLQDDDVPELDFALHTAIKKVTESIDSLRFNTAIADMMVFTNEATKAGKVGRQQFASFVRILAPFAPHLCEELWEQLGHADGVTYAPWPAHDESKLVVQTTTMPVQINGKLRAKINVAPDVAKDDALALAKADPNVAKYLAEGDLKREIFVPGRLINLVVK